MKTTTQTTTAPAQRPALVRTPTATTPANRISPAQVALFAAYAAGIILLCATTINNL